MEPSLSPGRPDGPAAPEGAPGPAMGGALLDPGLCIVSVDEVMAGLLGLPAAELLGRFAPPLLSARAPGGAALLAEVAASGVPRLDLALPPGADGERWLVGAYPLGEGAGLGLVAVATAGGGGRRAAPGLAELSLRAFAEHAADLIYRVRLGPGGGYEYVSPSCAAITGYSAEEYYADPALGLKIVHPHDRMQLQSLMAGGDSGRPLALRWVHKDGGIVWTEQRSRVVRDPAGRPVAIEGIARDVTARRRTEDALSQALDAERHARHVAEVLHSANLALTRSLDADEVMAALLEHLARLVPYDSANVMLLEGEGRLAVRAARGYERFIGGGQIAAVAVDADEDPILQRILARRRSFLVLDTAQMQRWRHRPGLGHVRNWVGVPLVAGEQLIGLFALDKAEPGFFTPEHVDLAELLATPAALALQNARLFAEVMGGRERMRALSERLVAVQEAERAHLARELHDEIGQMLTSLSLALTVSERLPPAVLRERVGQVQRQINQLTAQVRTLSLNLRPAMLDDLGLLPALVWFTRRYSDQTGIQVQLQHAGLARPIAPAVGATAYRVLQEALTNVARHARVDRARVQVWATDAILAVQVVDEGVGFAVEAALTSYSSSGLVGMQERVRLAGGSLSIESGPGQGARLLAEIPLDTGAEAEQAPA